MFIPSLPRVLGFTSASLGTVFAACMLMGGWFSVALQSKRIETSTIQVNQQAHLEIVRNAARAAQVYITAELARRGEADLIAIEQEALKYFVNPIRIEASGDAWIYSPTHVVFDQSEDFPPAYVGKSMAEIFALQKQHGASHYESMTSAVMNGQEGIGWYIWEPDKARAASPWWEPLTQDAGREIAAWTPVTVFPGTSRQQIWVIGVSAMLPELMQANGAYALINTSILIMAIVTVFAGLLLTKLWQREHALQRAKDQYQAIVEDQTELICRFLPDGGLQFVNQAYAQTLGSTPAQLVGENLYGLMPESAQATVKACVADLTLEHPVATIEHAAIGPEQMWRWQQWTHRLLLDRKGEPVGVQAVGRDITAQKKAAAEIERLAYTDFLTGLANRRQLYRLGSRCLEGQSATTAKVALLYLDLDRFKTINDTLGHDTGDALLVELGHRLRRCLQDQDLLARLGGDEFAILLHPADRGMACAVAKRINEAMLAPFHVYGQSIQIGCSIGIALSDEATLSFSQLLTQADIALYRAKATAKANYVVFNRSMQLAVMARSILEEELHQALKNQELCLYYQPIINLQTYQLSGFEALIRWQHPTRGLLPPAQFLSMVVDMGLSCLLDRWVLQQACSQLAQWQTMDTVSGNPSLSVNLSSSQFSQLDLVTYLATLIAEVNLRPEELTLEITEEVMIHQPEQVMEVLSRLRQIGVRISLDDFGTGYSSLSYLHQFPVDLLKIDRSFVNQMTPGSPQKNIVGTIITLAQNFDILTVAEGIENRYQLEQLQAINCQYGQGNFFFKPLTAAAATTLLQSFSLPPPAWLPSPPASQPVPDNGIKPAVAKVPSTPGGT